MEDNTKNEKKDTLDVYEISYLLLPMLKEEDAVIKAGDLKETLQSIGASLVSDESPVLIDLSYSMTKVIQTTRHKCTSGYFGWVKFEMEKENIKEVKKALEGNESVLRFLIIKTVKESTLLHGKMMFKKEEKVRKEEVINGDTPEGEKESAIEELDKSIDDLVIV